MAEKKTKGTKATPKKRAPAKDGARARKAASATPQVTKPKPATRLAEPLSDAAVGAPDAVEDVALDAVDEGCTTADDGKMSRRRQMMDDLAEEGGGVDVGVNLELDLDDGAIEEGEFPPTIPIEWKRKHGGRREGAGRRPSLICNDVTIGRIKRLAAMACTKEEAAAYLLVDKRTLEHFFKKYPVAAHAWEDGQNIGKISLRRIQWRHAVEHPQTANFLGKNLLGQAEVIKNENNDLADAIRETAGTLDSKLFALVERLRNQKFSGESNDG